MTFLQVHPQGLEALAAKCNCLAGEVRVHSVAPELSLPFGQATAAAVQAVSASVTAAGASMAARMASTATKLSSAASTFAEQEKISAGKLASLAAASAV